MGAGRLVGSAVVRVLSVLLACLLVAPATAAAAISDVTAIDGPSADIVDFGGAAMAPDGTGGIVYRKRVDGRTHIFAVQFDGRRWRGPQRVDNGQRFDSSWPAIAAGNGGRLVVAWVQEFGPSSDRMYSAGIDPGASRFQAPVPIDLNVGESIATHPSIAMSAGGSAYVAYLVMQAPTDTDLPGFARGELRAARYDGTYWSGFGLPLNRNAQAPLPLAVAGGTPQVTIDSTGNGILAWREGDDELIPRIWARRLFGTNMGIATQVSPGTLNNAPLRAPADLFSLDSAGFGQGAIAYRQQPQPNGPINGTRVMLATIPETSSPDAAAFGTPRIVDGAGNGGPATAPGAPAVAVDRVGDTATAFGLAQRTLLTSADDRAVRAPERLDDGRSSTPGTPLVDLAASGAAVAAWQVRRGSAGGIGVSERRADGVPVTQTAVAPAGGVVSGLGLAGSGLGDAIVGWLQGGQVAALVVDAPPDPFAANTPTEYVRTPPLIRWDMPGHAIGGVTFTLTLDDDTLVESLRSTRYRLRRRQLDDGVHVLQVVATDAGGQETTSQPADLRIDMSRPRVRVRRYRNRLVEVRVTDSPAGVLNSSVRISWGDGKRSSGRRIAAHRYAGGSYRITVSARDRAGNSVTVKRRVSL